MVVTGRVAPDQVAQVSAVLDDALELQVRRLVVDLTHSSGGAPLLPLLARSRAALVARGSALHLVGVALPDLLTALIAAPIEDVFPIYDVVRTKRRPVVADSGRGRSVRRRPAW